MGAMDEEIRHYKDALLAPEPVEKAGTTFYTGSWAGRPVVLCKSGVGKVNAAIAAQTLISEFGVGEIIFTGVAGALDPGLDIGDIVVSTDCRYHDMDATPLGFPRGDIPFSPESVFPAEPGLVARALEAARAAHGGKVVAGRILSGDQFIGDPEAARRLREQFGGACVEMEGAAVAHVCRRNGVPFVVIRAMSDRADGSAPDDFAAFIRDASRKTFGIVDRMLAD